ncbi:MAG: maleylpyruvate isomerase family mycothiol-dependent enzyme [Micromonosporaceae bacterium]
MRPEALDDLDPFDILDAEAERIDRHFSGLRVDQWLRPSACTGWSVRDVLGHLAGEEAYNHACLDGDVAGFYRMLDEAGVRGLGGFNQWCVAQRRDLPVADVLDEWRTGNGETRRRMAERGRTGHLDTSIGPYPVGLQAFHYASEYATHADDVDAPVESYEEPARTQWRSRVGQFVLEEMHSPVEVESRDGGYRVSVGTVSDLLSASDFVTATVNRLPDDHPLDPSLRSGLAVLA